MPPLTREQVQHIASLCRIAMSDADIERMRGELSNILDQFEALRRLDTSNVEPTSHSIDVHSVLRQDEPRPSLSQADILRNAPRVEEGYLRIQAVLED